MAQCTAKAKQTGEQCKRPAGWAPVCRMHGGAIPAVRAKAMARKEEANAAAQVARELAAAKKAGISTAVDNPFAELAQLAGQIQRLNATLGQQVERLPTIDSRDHKGAEQVKAIFAAWERSQERYMAILGLIAKLDIDNRLIRLEEAKVLLVLRGLEAALAAQGIAGPQARAIRTDFAKQIEGVPA